MKLTTEIPYWITLAHLPKWGAEKINRLVVKIIHENQLSLETFFNEESIWNKSFELTAADIADLQKAKLELPNNAFLAEDLLAQGFELVSINSPAYSKTLKNNLKLKAPTVLYIKGNKQIMQEESIAIVGSRDADETSLQFTDHIARIASQQYKVVVSGFAKGVDKQALDSALKYKGQSIIVLPQGIMTFGSGIKKYYQQITTGDLLVVSIFHPQATWGAGLAMARNPIIYALASEIYAAQSAESGGTWSGVLDGLKKGRTIFVRQPLPGEKNANALLIEKGATPVNQQGNPVASAQTGDSNAQPVDKTKENLVRITTLLSEQPLTPEQILEKVPLNITKAALAKLLKTLPQIQKITKSKKVHYAISQNTPTLF
ncbi:MAG TPA: DNA transporter [Microscillaceae bacterium]|nr:DNA transporter [Microscillaceae bacterium]